MIRQLSLVAALCCIAFAMESFIGAQAGRIIATRQEFYVLNGQGPFYGNNSLTYQCDPQDTAQGLSEEFDVAGFDGSNRHVKITCNQVFHYYALEIKGFTFYTGQLQSFIYALLPANFNFNLTAGNEFVDPTGRQLLQLPPTPSPGTVGTFTNPDGGANVVQCGATQFANQLLLGIPSGVIGPTTGASGCGGPYVSTAAFSRYLEHQDKVEQQNVENWKTQVNFNNAVNSTIKTISQAIDAINGSLAGIANYMEYNNVYIAAQQQINSNNTAFLTRLTLNVNQDLSATNAAVAENTRLIVEQTQIMEDYIKDHQSELNDILLQQAILNTNLSTQIQNLSAQIVVLNSQATLDKLSLSTQILALEALVVNWNQNTQLKRDVAQMLQASFNYVQEQQQLVPFLNSLGVPPPADLRNLPPTLATIIVNVITKQFLYSNPDTSPPNKPYMASIEFAWKCTTAVVGTNPTLWGSFVDTLNALGPINCTGPTGNKLCNCWIDITDTRAQIECKGGSASCIDGPAQQIPSDEALAFWENGLNPAITPKIPGTSTNLVFGGNAGNIGPGRFDKVRVTNAIEYLNISESICSLGINQYYFLWMNGPGGYAPGYRIYSAFNSTSISAPYDSSTCHITLQQAMQPPTQGPFSTLYAEMQFATIGYNYGVQTIDPIQLFGSVPNYITWEMEPTAQLAGGVVNTLWRFWYMAFNEITTNDDSTAPYYGSIPVWQLTFISTVATMDVEIDYSGAQTFTAINTNPASILLPPDGFVGMGDPVLSWTGVAHAFNPPQGVMVLNPTKQGICGTPIYNMMPSPFNLTRDAWADAAGISYDHRCGSNVAAIYQVTIDQDTFQCSQAPGNVNPAATGTLCDLLAAYTATPNTQGNLITMAFSGRPGTNIGETTQATFSVPAGEVRNIVNTACPSATEVIQGFNVKSLVFTNPLTTTNTIRVRRIGPCHLTTDLVLPPSGQSQPFVISFCPSQPSGATETIFISTIPFVGSIGVLQDCSNVSVSLDYQQLGATPAPASYNTTQVMTKASIDQTSTTAQAIQNAAIALQWEAIANLYSVFPSAGLQIPPASQVNFTKTYNAFVALNAQAQADLANNTNRVIGNYTGDLLNYQQIYAFNAAQQQAAQQGMQDALNSVLAFNALVSQNGQALDQQALLLAGLAGAVASNVSALIEIVNTPVDYGGGTPLTLGDLLNNLITGLADGIGNAALTIAHTAGQIIQELAELPAGLINLLTSTFGMIMLWIAAILSPILMVVIIVGGVYLKRVTDDVKMLKMVMRIPDNATAAAPAPGVAPAAPSGPLSTVNVPMAPPAQQPPMGPIMAAAPPAQQPPMGVPMAAGPPGQQFAPMPVLPTPAAQQLIGALPSIPYMTGRKGPRRARPMAAATESQGLLNSAAAGSVDAELDVDFNPRAPDSSFDTSA